MRLLASFSLSHTTLFCPSQEFEAAWGRLQDELSQETSQRSIISKQLDVVKSKVGSLLDLCKLDTCCAEGCLC